MKKLLAFLALGLMVTGSAFAVGSSDPSIPMNNDGWIIGPDRADVLLISTTDVALNGALDQLGVVYDYYAGEDFSGVDLSGYTHVFVAMDGGLVEGPSVSHGADFATAGGHLHFYGGTCYQPFAMAVNDYLVQNDINNYCWQTVGGVPHSTVTDPNNCLAIGLPSSYNFADISATYYSLRATDPGIAVAAVNGDGVPHLFSKAIGAGSFDICINSPYVSYYNNGSDFDWLKTVVNNMLNCGGPVAVQETTLGRVKALYR
ncbi:MAG: hypothetical protein ACE15D_14915 [Candidatus Eisenbacteria bacterium]